MSYLQPLFCKREREMGDEGKQERRRHRVVMVLCPLQGHITPMLQLATALHSQGSFSITIIHPYFNSPNPSHHPYLSFLPIPDGLHQPTGFPDNIGSLVSTLHRHCQLGLRERLSQMVENQQLDPDGERICCIVFDTLMNFSEAVADEFRVPSINFRTSAASSVLVYSAITRMQEEGQISFQDIMKEELVPDLYPIRYKDLPISHFASLQDSLKLVATPSNIKSSCATIWNTTPSLEQSSLQKLRQQRETPIFPIGPLHRVASIPSSSILEEDSDCIPWLNKQSPNSVIYVSLGSVALLDEKSLAEMAWGLANSGQPFLWVVRPGSVRGSGWIELLPEDFKPVLKERGYVVKWAPQKEVLAHSAVGGFWSHCGWNSTLESICEGVPMMCSPCFGDQRVNTRWLSRVWRIGVELGKELERGSIERAVRRLMVEKEGEEMRERAIELKEKVEMSVREGGSSYSSLNDLKEFILSL